MTILVSNNQHDHSVCVNCGERIFKRDARSPILELYICDNWSHQLYTWPFSLCYFAEKDIPDTGYTSIPEAMWWAIQTLTSVRQITRLLSINLLGCPIPPAPAPSQKNLVGPHSLTKRGILDPLVSKRLGKNSELKISTFFYDKAILLSFRGKSAHIHQFCQEVSTWMDSYSNIITKTHI